MTTWLQHVEKWKDCTDCPLCEQRDRIVLARGTLPCDVLFVGEAPGASEDSVGQPFVEGAPAGRLLMQIIDRSLVPTVSYALTNLVCCFPREAKRTTNHQPEHDEIMACMTRLVEFVNIARPKLIVCVGSLPAQYVDHHDTVACADIVHPAHILAHMPKAQQHYAVQKSVVVIRTAVDRMLECKQEFTNWGARHAESRARTSRHVPNDIPF